jgi:hypothetical protein
MVKGIVLCKPTARKLVEDTNTDTSNDAEATRLDIEGHMDFNYETISLNDYATFEDVEGQMNAYHFPAAVGNVSVDGAIVNSANADSIVSPMLQPSEASQLFRIPSKSSIGSDIVYVNSRIS